MRRYCWFVIVALLPLFVSASEYRATNFAPVDGLSQATVRYVFQDKWGYMWLCSADGLNRYDGVNNTIFRKNISDPLSINSSNFLSITQDKSGNYWIGSDGDGLFKLDTRTNRFINYRMAGDNNSIREIVVTDDDKLWLLTKSSLISAKIGNSLEILTEITVDEFGNRLEINNIRYINKNLFVLAKTGLKRVVSNGKYEVVSDALFNNIEVVDVRFDAGNNIWVGTGKSILRKQEQKDVETMLTLDDQLIALDLDRSGNLWVYYKKSGLIKIAPDGALEYAETNKKTFFSRNNILGIKIDDADNLWFYSTNKGVSRISLVENKFGHIRELDKFPVKNPSAVILDRNNNLWIGTQYDGLFVTADKKNAKRFLQDNYIRTLVESRTKVWVATENRLYAADKNVVGEPTDVFKRCGIAPTEKIAIGYASDDRIWVGTYSGLYKIGYQEGNLLCEKFTVSITDPVVIAEDRQGQLWIGTENDGIFLLQILPEGVKIRRQFINVINDPQSISDNHIRALELSADNIVWIGTDYGLNRIDVNTLENQRYPAITAKIVTITRDREGILWIGTVRNLTRFDPSNQNIRIYNTRNGITSSFVTGASSMDAHGIVYIGTIDALDYFDPLDIRINAYKPVPLINGIMLDGREITAGDEISGRVLLDEPVQECRTLKLKWYENNFAIAYTALQFNDITENRASYRLEGFDRDFIASAAPAGTVQYNNIPPGRYTFRLKARNNDDTWSENDREIAITITPAPWATWWAYLIYIVLGALFLYLVIRHVKERIDLRQRLQIEGIKLSNQKWLIEEKSRFYGNITHEIKTPLTLIVSPVKELAAHNNLDEFSRKRVDIIRTNSEKLMALLNEFVDFRKIESQNSPLLISKHNLSELMQGIKVSFNHLAEQKDIRYHLVDELTEPCCWFDDSKVTKIVNNILSNAFKFTEASGVIYLFVSQTEVNFTVTVTDSGCGIDPKEQEKVFDRFYRVKSSQNIDGMGIGLALVKSLVELHKGRISVRSSENLGTTLSITLPSTKADYADCQITEQNECADYRSDAAGEDSPATTKPLIVIAEDNHEVASYMQEVLEDKFFVRVFPNGRAAYDYIVKYLPDVILTDIKMNGGDGVELCNRVKTNMFISHIPVIMLSAMDSDEDIRAGYLAGAEDYITKPFDIQTLKLKINNLIRGFADDSRKGATAAEAPCRERRFIDQVVKIVEDNIENQDLNGDFICDKLAISKMQLYRKLRTYTGKGSSEFIRSIRLRKAKEMLDKGYDSITEILYTVGFNSPSYFTKSFKEEFGVTPSEYLSK